MNGIGRSILQRLAAVRHRWRPDHDDRGVDKAALRRAGISTAYAQNLVRLDYGPANIVLHVTSELERRYRATNCKKEPWTVRWLEQYVHAGDVVYDIGANVGTFSLIAALGRGASVVAFEPGYANFARLCENIWLNSCNELILPVPLPLLDKTAQTRFRYRTLEPGQSRHVIDAVDAPVRSPKQLYGVEQMMCGIRLDEARVLFSLPNPNHIKLDVDGTELRALNGALETLSATSLKSVLIEADPDGWPRIEQVLSDAGLSVVREIRRDGAPLYAIAERRGCPERPT